MKEGCKARHCADGSVQRKWMPPGEASSPTVLTESVFLTSAIDVQEKRKNKVVTLPRKALPTGDGLTKKFESISW